MRSSSEMFLHVLKTGCKVEALSYRMDLVERALA